MKRVTFSSMLDELLGALVPDGGAALRLAELEVDLPIEVAVAWDGGVPVFLANPRRWRLPTPFDEQPGRLTIRIKADGVRS